MADTAQCDTRKALVTIRCREHSDEVLAPPGLVIASLLTTPSHGQAQAQSERGRTFAEAKCAPCHAVGRVGNSVHPYAPPFRALVQLDRAEKMEQPLDEAIAKAIKAPHSNPPFELDQVQILIAYLSSLEH